MAIFSLLKYILYILLLAYNYVSTWLDTMRQKHNLSMLIQQEFIESVKSLSCVWFSATSCTVAH